MNNSGLVYYIVISALVLLRGSRAAFLCILIYSILAYVVINKKAMKSGKVIRLVVIGVVGSICLLNFNAIINLLSQIAPGSRTLFLLSTNISYDSGRSNIYDIYKEAIAEAPFKYNGIFSDRVYYSIKSGSSFNLTNYAHSLWYEVLYQFGIPIGILFFALLVFLMIKTIISLKNSDSSMMWCMFFLLFVSGIIKLFFSASYLTSLEFYLILGFMMYSSSIKNYEVW